MSKLGLFIDLALAPIYAWFEWSPDRLHILHSAIEPDSRRGSQLLTEWDQQIHNWGSWKDLEILCVGKGPGSFTGLRVCLAFAQGLKAGGLCKIYSRSSLELLAKGLDTKQDWIGLVAKRGFLYGYHPQKGGQLLTQQRWENINGPKRILDPSDLITFNFSNSVSFCLKKSEDCDDTLLPQYLNPSSAEEKFAS